MMEQQEARVEIIKIMGYNNMVSGPEKTREYAAKEATVVYGGEHTSYIAELKKLGDIKAEFSIAFGEWEAIEASIGILRSILGYEREVVRQL
jgi:hypothetical protein